MEDEIDQVRAQAKGQEIDEAKVRDSIEARLEKNMVRYDISSLWVELLVVCLWWKVVLLGPRSDWPLLVSK